MNLIRLYPKRIRNTYQLILEAEEFEQILLIVLSDYEVFTIMSVIEGDYSTTHRLFQNFAKQLGVDFAKVVIYQFDCGIFKTKIIYQHNNVQYSLEAPVAEAISLAIDAEIPIFANQALIDEVGITLDAEQEQEQNLMADDDTWEYLPTQKLYELLNQAVEDEDYETAIQIRDEITRREIL